LLYNLIPIQHHVILHGQADGQVCEVYWSEDFEDSVKNCWLSLLHCKKHQYVKEQKAITLTTCGLYYMLLVVTKIISN